MRILFWRDAVSSIYKVLPRTTASAASSLHPPCRSCLAVARAPPSPSILCCLRLQTRLRNTASHTPTCAASSPPERLTLMMDPLSQSRSPLTELIFSQPDGVQDIEQYAEATSSSLLYLTLEALGMQDHAVLNECASHVVRWPSSTCCCLAHTWPGAGTGHHHRPALAANPCAQAQGHAFVFVFAAHVIVRLTCV